ncbi:MAG: cbb3-type cytochrome c oxidase subunit I [Opitutaceae bacterium]|nr:cbb3-type cytochrome c oxidase subunit I [Opitutaceae bacterium]
MPHPAAILAQSAPPLWGQPGIVITAILLAIPLAVGVWLIGLKLSAARDRRHTGGVSGDHLHRDEPAAGSAGDQSTRSAALIRNVDQSGTIRFLPVKKAAQRRPEIHAPLARLILWYLGAATFWLLFGTTVGEYLGIKFVAPDADHLSWLSFGRLRPVHTNAVFWGWASLAMIGLGYYVVARVGNVRLASMKAGWWTFGLMNAAVVLGSLALMAGINNGGGEYREYVWPIMLLFASGIIIALCNFLATIARRQTSDIYISNWYMVAALMFVITIVLVAYLPFWQDGLGETIIQGYYMHQGVGMWFMMYLLGLTYYFLPQQLNTPIFSYSLGILAFWTQILFYTVIGTHHFVFSSIPWSIQTIAIVGSMGMVIPVVAGTANFLLTFRGAFHKIGGSYTLPFFLVGVVFYFTGSLQGTAEAFRWTNLVWHFTDFTVAHSHLTMYGIISFLLWACIYAVVPRLTGREPPQATVGAHFWMALIGLLFYSIPLMVGGTLRGIAWLDGVPFIETVSLMAPFWLWRAIGGTLMWLSHGIFAYNMYKMIAGGARHEAPSPVEEGAVI